MVIEAITNKQVVYDQEPFVIQWAGVEYDDTEWVTRDELTLEGGQWVLAPPFDDLTYLNQQLDAIPVSMEIEKKINLRKRKIQHSVPPILASAPNAGRSAAEEGPQC